MNLKPNLNYTTDTVHRQTILRDLPLQTSTMKIVSERDVISSTNYLNLIVGAHRVKDLKFLVSSETSKKKHKKLKVSKKGGPLGRKMEDNSLFSNGHKQIALSEETNITIKIQVTDDIE